MKKIIALTFLFLGVFCFSQNQNNVLAIFNKTSYTIQGRMGAGNPNPPHYPFVIPISTSPSGLYTIPPNTDTKFDSLNTSGTAIVPVSQWEVISAPQNSMIYPYNHPIISNVMNIVKWAYYDFFTVDTQGNVIDRFQMGDPTLSPSSSTIVYGQNMPNIHAEWVQYAGFIALTIYQN